MDILLHWFGLDNSSGIPYLFWSGIAGDLFIIGAVTGWYHKHNCHQERCLRIGKHVHEGTPYCSKHNPNFKE